jgi:proteasome lid subunit RPN8/RPN11
VAACGATGVETGGFLLVHRPDPAVTGVLALAGATGIVRQPDQFIISGAAVDLLSEWAENYDLRVVAQFHSHRGPAFLSSIDRRGGMRVAGFISAVIPNFRRPPASPDAWAWFTFIAGGWQLRPPLRSVRGEVQIISFDEEGIVER